MKIVIIQFILIVIQVYAVFIAGDTYPLIINKGFNTFIGIFICVPVLLLNLLE